MNTHGHIHWLTHYGKRTVDIVGSLFGLAILFPIWPLIALAIRIDSPGPIFFRQTRIGRIHPDWVELFQMIKFRTMRQDAEKGTGPVWSKEGDTRITRVGQFLRKSRLDELPQLINVLKGEMSLVGPRPERPGFYNCLEDAIPFFVERTYGVSPGITGLAQVKQGYDRNLDDVRSKLAYDLAYAMALTTPGGWLKMDLTIIWHTLRVMAGMRGR